MLGDYETEQLCAKLTLGELQGLCASLAADGVDREQMVALLEVRHSCCLQCPLRFTLVSLACASAHRLLSWRSLRQPGPAKW